MNGFVTSIAPILPLLGVVIGSLSTFLVTWYFTKRTESRAIRQTAAQLAQYLDVFAFSCADIIIENKVNVECGGMVSILHNSLPPLNKFPRKTDLKLVEPEPLSQLLAFRLKWEMAASTIRSWYAAGSDHLEIAHKVDNLCGELGMEALEISEILRKKAKLPKPHYERYFKDFSKTLSKKRERASE